MVNETQKAEFNDAISYLNRINYIFYSCMEASTNLDAHAWHQSLLALFRELSDEMDEEQLNKFKAMGKQIAWMIFRNPTNDIPVPLYDKLNEMEIELRQLFKKTGMKMKYAEDAREALR